MVLAMFLELEWLKQVLNENPEDYENIVKLLGIAELLGQLELIENLQVVVEQWGEEIPKENVMAALGKARSDILEELRGLFAEKPFFQAAMSELVRTPLTEEIREEAKKALEKMRQR